MSSQKNSETNERAWRYFENFDKEQRIREKINNAKFSIPKKRQEIYREGWDRIFGQDDSSD